MRQVRQLDLFLLEPSSLMMSHSRVDSVKPRNGRSYYCLDRWLKEEWSGGGGRGDLRGSMHWELVWLTGEALSSYHSQTYLRIQLRLTVLTESSRDTHFPLHSHPLIYPLTARVVGVQHRWFLQPVSSIFSCSQLPSGTWRTPGLSISWCCLPIFPLSALPLSH